MCLFSMVKLNCQSYLNKLGLYFMENATGLIKVFTGNETSVAILTGRLEEAGIPSLVKNDSFKAYLGVIPQAVDLYIKESDLPIAELLINEFIQTNSSL